MALFFAEVLNRHRQRGQARPTTENEVQDELTK
jgi:hypothetical protein